METAYTYNANDQLVHEVHTEQLVALPVGGGIHFRPLPGVWAKIGFWSVPVAMLFAFLIPYLLAYNKRWFGAENSGSPGTFRPTLRELCCILLGRAKPPAERSSVDREAYPRPSKLHPIWCGVTGMLVVTAVVAGLPFEVLAQESALYAQVEASDWGKSGTTTLYEYDSNGSLVRKAITGTQSQVEVYRYNLQNRMTGMTRTETRDGVVTETVTQYAYNTAGIRLSSAETVRIDGVVSTEAAKTFLIDSDNPTGYAQVLEEQQTGANPATVRYVIGDDVLSQSTTRNLELETRNLLPDGHGSTRQLVDSTGSVTAQFSYDSYGHMLGSQAGAQAKQKTSMLYSGEQFDSTLQQYYLRARYYNQENGRFGSVDPYRGNLYDPQSLHKYAYCHDEPVNANDPSGEMSLSEIMIAGAISMGISLVVNFSIFKSKKSTWQIVGEAALAGIAGIVGVPVAILAASIATSGILALVLASVMIGVFSVGFELLQQVLGTGQTDPVKLLIAFIVGALSGAVGLYLGELIDNPRLLAEMLVPYFGGLSSGFLGELIDQLRSAMKDLSLKKDIYNLKFTY